MSESSSAAISQAHANLHEALHQEFDAYVRARPALVRVLEAAGRKLRTMNGPRGVLPLDDIEEREAVEAIGAKLQGRGRNRVALEELDRALREATHFSCSLRDALSQWYGQPFQTRDEMTAEAGRRWAQFQEDFRAACAMGGLIGGNAAAGEAVGTQWLRVDEPFLRSTSRQDGKLKSLLGAARALGLIATLRTPDAQILTIPVLALRAFGHPHALDAKTAAASLMCRGIAMTTSPDTRPWPIENAEDRAALYASVNLAIDELSSSVAVFGVAGTSDVVAAAQRTRSVLVVPVAVLGTLGDIRAAGPTVFAVENPAVFMAIVRALQQVPPTQVVPTVVCTSGQLSVAARRLLDLLVAHGATIAYSGDFDQDGVTIARWMARRWPSAVVGWRWNLADYDLARAEHRAGNREAVATCHPLAEELDAVLTRISTHGPAFQEALIDALIADVVAVADSNERAIKLPVRSD